MRSHLARILLLVLPVFCTPGLSQEAYDISRTSVRATTQSHWRAWEIQNDLLRRVKITADSSNVLVIDRQGVRPRFFHGLRNLAANCRDFEYADVVRAASQMVRGGGTALSNDALANRVVDDNLNTYWEPADEQFNQEGLREWELEVDLGRLTVIDSVTLIFPRGDLNDDLGDPLKSFALFAATGQRLGIDAGITDSRDLRFDLIGKGSDRDLVPDPSGRALQITFAVPPLELTDFGMDGQEDMDESFVQWFRIKATDSAYGRRTYIGEGEEARVAYDALAAERRGDRVFPRYTAEAGYLTPVPEAAYYKLPEDRRAPIQYYIREVPRILEVRAWGKGDNAALHPQLRAGASYEQGGMGNPWLATDGIIQSYWSANVYSPIIDRGTMWLDLGATFWVDQMFIMMKLTTGTAKGSFRGHEFFVSDGTLLNPVSMDSKEDMRQLETGLKWDDVVAIDKQDNYDPHVRMFEQQMPRRKIRFMQIRNTDISGRLQGAYTDPGQLAEIGLFGEGYPVSVWLYSPPILLQEGDIASVRTTTLSTIEWDGDAVVMRRDPQTQALVESYEPLNLHPEVELVIQSRTSEKTDTLWTFYEDAGGVLSEIGEQRYNDIVFEWALYDYVSTHADAKAKTDLQKLSVDDDGDGAMNEDWPDGVDNDGDGLIDEDWTKIRRAPKAQARREPELQFTGWSSWSSPYQPTGGRNEATIKSPSPRKFLQMRVNMKSEDPYKTARITSLRANLVAPVALELGGEVALLTEAGTARPITEAPDTADYAPPRGVDPLETQTFAYFIRAARPDPQQVSVRRGLNEILILTGEPAEVIGVRTGRVEVYERAGEVDTTAVFTTARETTFERYYAPGADGVLRDANGDSLTVISRAGSDSLHLRLPRSLNQGLTEGVDGIAEIQFRTRVFQEGTEFKSFVRYIPGDDFYQRVETSNRDATELVESSTASISLDHSKKGLVQALEAPGVFTPNGDGVNDELLINFTLLRILTGVPVEVTFHSLSGLLVGRAAPTGSSFSTEEGTREMGTQQFSWDGRNPGGGLVPPGIYLMKIVAEGDAEDDVTLRSVNVAY